MEGYVFPASAGMIPNKALDELEKERVPRKRGDDPTAESVSGSTPACSPQARG